MLYPAELRDRTLAASAQLVRGSLLAQFGGSGHDAAVLGVDGAAKEAMSAMPHPGQCKWRHRTDWDKVLDGLEVAGRRHGHRDRAQVSRYR